MSYNLEEFSSVMDLFITELVEVKQGGTPSEQVTGIPAFKLVEAGSAIGIPIAELLQVENGKPTFAHPEYSLPETTTLVIQ